MTNNKSKQSVNAVSLKYRHLFFDLDHTLWDFDTNAKESLEELYRIFDLELKLISPFDLFYTTYLRHNTILWDDYEKGFISSDDLKWKRMSRSLLDFKIGDEVLAKEMGAKFLEILPITVLPCLLCLTPMMPLNRLSTSKPWKFITRNITRLILPT